MTALPEGRNVCNVCGTLKDDYGCPNMDCIGDEPIPELTDQEKLEIVNQVWDATPFPVRHFASRYAQLQRLVALGAPSLVAIEQRRLIREAIVNLRTWLDEYETDLGMG